MPTTPAYRALIEAFTRLSRVQREAGTEMARELDCPRATLSLLWLLEKRGPLGIGDVAQQLHVDMSVASRQASALVDAGYAERSTPEPGTDRRVRTIRLTEAGRAFTAQSRSRLDERLARVFADWDVDDLLDAAHQMSRVADALAADAGYPVGDPGTAPAQGPATAARAELVTAT